ncbi:hypothetical protein Leryth_004291 [Lithospermum erythrorhizon]|nr:hypothetical protein Leryth_004291 [Lithospermum erythrorhizon]
MEHVEAMPEGEWNNCSSVMYSSSSTEEADFMAQLIGNNCTLPSESSLATTTLFNWPVHESNMDMSALVHGMDESSMFSPNQGENHNASTNMYYYFSEDSNNSSGTSISLFTSSSYHHEGYYHPIASDEQSQMFRTTYVLETKNTNQYSMGAGDDDLNQDVSSEDIMDYPSENKPIIDHNGIDGMINLQLGIENDMPGVPKSSLPPNELSAALGKKRPRDSIVNNVQTNKRMVKAKKNRMLASSEDDEGEKNEAIFQKQNSVLSRTSIDEVDSNAFQETKGGATSSPYPKGDEVENLRGKTRASRGAATDPQSLYARKRRERINERLRILQNLVPNGTKVDISTMLEEAVQYVKFLQLQIKLLSSDDTWMYAPIAYNGMDIGLLHRNIDASSS